MNRKESASLGGKANAVISHKKHLEDYLKNPKYCKCCGEVIPYERRRYKTCSNDCSIELQKKSSGFKMVDGYDKPQICKYCGKVCKNLNSLKQHEVRCKLNPNHITIIPHKDSGKWDRSNWSPWNKGLTKETDSRVLKITESNINKYNQGLIKNGGKASTYEKEIERKQKISKSMKEKGCGGKRHGSGRGKKGWYKGIFCDSSWELAFVIYHLDHNLNISRCTENRTYEWKGKVHTYIPDFVTDEGIIEIKGYDSEKWQSKLYCNPDIIVLYEDDMNLYLNYVIDKYGKDYTLLYE